MKDPFLEQQWRELNERLQGCATHLAGSDAGLAQTFAEQAAAFGDNTPPERYPQLLQRVREAAEMAVAWQNQRDGQATDRHSADGEAGRMESRLHQPHQAAETLPAQLV